MRILITGSSGFIGFSLKNFLETKGIEVIPYDLKDTQSNDVRDFSNLKLKMEGVDGVIHLAAISRVKWAYEDPLECVRTNVGGTVNVLQAAREAEGSPWVIFGSSREVYGEPKSFPATEESPIDPINVYGIAKVAGEKLCQFFSKDYGLKTRVLRFSNVFTGENDQLDRVIPKFILRALKNEDLIINGTGEEVFDFTYIGDTVQGILGCIQEVEKSQQLYNDFILSTGRPTTLKELAEIIIEVTGSKSEIKYAKSRAYDVNKFYADPKKAKSILGYNPKTSLKDGIGLAIREFLKIKDEIKIMAKKLKVLSLGYSRELLVPSEVEKGETSKRLGFYASYLDKYFVLVFALKKSQLKKREIGDMMVIPTNGFNRLDALFKMYKLGEKICQENEIDIIQAQDPVFTGLVGYLLKKEYKKPLNVCVYGCDPYDRNWLREKKINLILAPLAKYLIYHCDGVQVDGLKTFNSLIKRGGIPLSKIYYKPMVPQDIKRFKEANGKALRKELLKNGEEKIILFAGRLVKQKNIPFLLECYQKIIQKFSKVRLIIIGEGKEEKKLRDLAKKLKIQNKINLVESVPYSKMPEYFQAADIFILSSLYEGFPRVLMEAAMAGKPIVSTDVGGTEDIIVNRKNGFIIPQGDEKEFINKILFLLQNPEIAREIGRNGQEIMETKFDPQETSLKQISIWYELIKG